MPLLDYQPDPIAQGLLGFGAALMTPRALGGGMGPGLLAFNQGAMQAQQARRLMAQEEMQRKLFDLKLMEAQETAKDRERARATQEALQQAARGAYKPASPGSLGGGVSPMSQQGQMLLAQTTGSTDPRSVAFDAEMLKETNAALNSVGPQQGVSAPTAGGFDDNAYISNLQALGFPAEAAKYRKDMLGDQTPKVVGGSLVTPSGQVLFTEDKPTVVAPGSSLVRGGKALFTAPDRPPAPSEVAKLAAEMNALPPNSPLRAAYADAIRKATTHAPPASVSVNTAFPKQMASVDAKIAGDDMAKWESARSARNAIRSLMQASPGAASGPAANAAVTVIDFLSSMGVAGDSLTKVSADTAAFNSQATELVLANIKKLGANPSNADLNEIKRLVPQITTSKAARDGVAQIMLKYTNRAELDAKHRFNYIQQNQGSAGWTPMKVNEMPKDQRQLMPGALYQHPITQEIAIYRGNGKFESVVGDD